MELRKLIIISVVFVMLLDFIATQDGSSSIHKEFDFPSIFYRLASEIESSRDRLKQPMKPVMELKKAMGPLPARLPPIYYTHQFNGHGPYEGDSKIIFHNPHEAAGLLMHGPYQQVVSSHLPMANFYANQMHDMMQQGSSKIDHLPDSPLAGLGPAGLAMMGAGAAAGMQAAGQRPAGTPMATPGQAGMAQRPAGAAAGTTPRPGAAAGTTPRPGAAAGTTPRPGAPTPPRPPTPPDFDYTEENLWLTGGLYLTALILKLLGTDVQFQTLFFQYPVGTGRRKRDSWTRFAMLDEHVPATIPHGPTGLNGNPDMGEMCLERAACQQPLWAKFYLDNLGEIKSGGKVRQVMDRIQAGISIDKNVCKVVFQCPELDLINKQFEKNT